MTYYVGVCVCVTRTIRAFFFFLSLSRFFPFHCILHFFHSIQFIIIYFSNFMTLLLLDNYPVGVVPANGTRNSVE